MTPGALASPDSRWPLWRAAAADSAVESGLLEIYGRIEAEVAARAPRCEASGRCCRFETHGHRLYVTALEIAWFLRRAPPVPPVTGSNAPRSEGAIPLTVLSGAPARDGCPWQVEQRCTAHGVRPMGCRVYFCEPGTEAWQHALYERMLDALGRLHERCGIPYRYLEWRQGLAEAESGLQLQTS